jgi:hypothetical protein
MFDLLFQKPSGFGPLFKTIADDIVEISLLLKEFSENFSDVESVRRRASVIEHKADETTYTAIKLVNSSFITPFDREDIHYLIHELDDVVDIIEDLIRNIYLYRPAAVPETLSQFAELILESSYALKALAEKYLDPPLYSPEMAALKKRLYVLEDRADEVFATGMRNLFVRLKDDLEDVMDKFLSVGKTIENVIVKTR